MQIKPGLKQARRFCQLLCLLIFLFLFRRTDYAGEDVIPYAVNLLFRLDPLVLASLTLATKSFISMLWPAFVIMGLTLVFGRVFCSWICPLGTLIDTFGRLIKPGMADTGNNLKYMKYVILITVLISSAFGIQFLGFVDPFSLLVRSLAFSVDPMFNYGVSGFFNLLYHHAPSWVSNLSEPFYLLLKDVILPYKQSFFYLAFLSFLIFIGIFALEGLGKRFWCRHLCPLGGLLSLISKFSIFKRIPLRACAHCRQCESKCRMRAFDENRRFQFEECNLCMDCLEFCPDQITSFRFAMPKPLPGSQPWVDMTRRQMVFSGIAGLALPVLTKTEAISRMPDEKMIRPPGARDEMEFLASCVRCGECMKVCINNALQPLFLERGLSAMFTPVLVPRLNYCEFNCTLCTGVCPTAALKKLTLEQKHGFVVGRAFFDKNKCLVYAKDQSCIVCEEHCPVHDKAIKFTETIVQKEGLGPISLKQPYVVESLCIGCGICEYVCPVEGMAAIRVYGKDQTRR